MKYKIGAWVFAYFALVTLSLIVAWLFGKSEYIFGTALVTTGVILTIASAVVSFTSLIASSTAATTTFKSDPYSSRKEIAQRIVNTKDAARGRFSAALVYPLAILSFAVATYICYWNNGQYEFPLSSDSLNIYGLIFLPAVGVLLLSIADTIVRIIVRGQRDEYDEAVEILNADQKSASSGTKVKKSKGFKILG